jgi:hypothetical protein
MKRVVEVTEVEGEGIEALLGRPVHARAAQGQRHKAKEEREGEKAALSTQAPSRTGKKALIGYFDPSVSKQLKQIALDRDGTIQDLLTEALNDLFQKLKKPTIA